MTDPTAAAREKAREIAHALCLNCRGGEPMGDDHVRYHTKVCDTLTESLTPHLIAAEQRGREAAVPKGWRLAPVEPTEAMHDAARDWSYAKYGKPIGLDASAGCWASMLAAAPHKGADDE